MIRQNKNKIKHICVAAILFGSMLMVAQSAAAEQSRFYLAGYMGLNIGSEQDFSDSANSVSGDVETNSAPSFAGALGLRLTKNIRAEAEISYRNNDIENFNVSGIGNVSASGDIDNWLGMMNLYYDFDVPWKIKPYISAGLGLGYYDGQFNAANGSRFNDTAYGLTWQAGAGLQYRSSDKLSWTAGYRYLDSSDLDFGDIDLDYSNHEIRVGLKYDLDWK